MRKDAYRIPFGLALCHTNDTRKFTHESTHEYLEKVGNKCDIKMLRYTKQEQTSNESDCNYLFNTKEQ